ncbi:hypothetical protein HYV10_02180 [Candidatus Dependentiae bacterium]|nr:hypothetical protein [Candidatus Dependentiae bacterium]
MKTVRYSLFFLFLIPLSGYLIAASSNAVASGAACNQVATVIFTQRLEMSNIAANFKAQLQQILNNLYLGYLVRQNGTEIFTRSGTDTNSIEAYWQALKNGTANYDSNPFCLYTALKQNPTDIQNNKICIDTASLQAQPVNIAYCQQNLKNMYEACGAYQIILKDFLSQIDPNAPLSIVGDVDQWQKNYVTFHLQKAVARLAQTCSIVCNGMSCAPNFTGDVRDRGMIVNIQNNTQKNFAIIQSTIDGKEAKQIGMLQPGLNNVNLNLASLQAANATAQTQSTYKFDIVEMGTNLSANEEFSIKIMSGSDILVFLKSINKNPKGLFYMNGRLLAPKYAVVPEGLYLILVKVPKNPTAAMMAYDKTADQTFPINQRIQVVALNSENPYFLTMQINEDEIEYETTKDAKEKLKATILQPSFFSVQSLPGLVFSGSQTEAKNSTVQNSTAKNIQTKKSSEPVLTNALPPIILPDFLSHNQNLNVYTTILQAAYIAASTDFAFFGQKSFTNDNMCYNLLGYFDKKNQRRLVLNLYSLRLNKKETLEIKNIMEAAFFETNINNYNDIPNLLVSQGERGNLISNEVESPYLNFEIKLNNSQMTYFLENKSFGLLYDIPFRNSIFLRLPTKKIAKNVFGYIEQKTLLEYEFIFKNKSDEILFKSKIYLHNKIKNIKIDFLDGNKNWVGSKISPELINKKETIFCKFKVNYTYDSVTKQYKLHTSAITPIDKIKVVHTIDLFELPLTEMYIDLYNKYEISTIYHCIVMQNGKMPSFLQTLTQDDWSRGIYMVTDVKDNNKLDFNNPGVLEITFYQLESLEKQDITKLGQIILQGKSDATGKVGITESVYAYNLTGKQFVDTYDVFLTTCILFKYVKIK